MSSFDKFVQPDLTITIDHGEKGFELGYRGPAMSKDGIKVPKTVADNLVQNRMIVFRTELSNWAKSYDDLLVPNNTQRITCDPLKVREMWTYLAKQGRALYRLLFDLDDRTELNLVGLAGILKDLPEGSIVELDALAAPLPWSLLYEGDLPKDDDPAYLQKLIPQFWGLRYQLIAHPPWGSNNINNKPYLSNNDGTRLTIAINKKSDEEYRTSQMSFFTAMKDKLNGPEGIDRQSLIALGTCKEHVIASLRTRQEPQHLYYFFCHHEKGDGEINIVGVADLFQQTQIIMEGEEQGVITLEELSTNSDIQPFKFPPVIFLNACHSNQLKMGDPTSFMTYFIRRLGSWNFIGTEADIPAPFADAFGKIFVEKFLNGQTVGDILFSLKNYYAKEHLNPFGLYYTLFGRGEIHLQNPVKAIG
jgi:hypothetical protein